jgi:glucose/arabinose dehydrogenase
MLSRLAKPVAAGAFALGLLAFAAAAATAQPLPTSSNGNPVSLVASGLNTPTSFAFGDGAVFEGDGGNETAQPPNGGVFLLNGATATLIPGSPQFVAGLAWHDDSLYVSGGTVTSTGISWQLQRWTGWNGNSFKHQRVIYTAPTGFDGFNGLGFGANGRLYVGVDVGITDGNDDGAASTSPYLYDILTFNANGNDLRVFATGMRQPWQMAFLPGSNDPFVSDLGPDSSSYTNPPDALLRVRQGQNYGFPTSLFGPGYAQPFQTFPAHTDVMGVGLFGGRIYLSEFGAVDPPQVVSIPLSGGTPQPLLTGFVAPIVGLGINGDRLYVGELTGDVYSVSLTTARNCEHGSGHSGHSGHGRHGHRHEGRGHHGRRDHNRRR